MICFYWIADEEESLFRFVNVGDGPTRYTIVSFQKSLENGTYHWKKVGNYSREFIISIL